jgi:hypothetical protein
VNTPAERPTASYLYAVCRRPPGPEPPEDLPGGLEGLGGPGEPIGVHGGPVRALADGDLVAIVETVPVDEFAEDALQRRLADLAQLEWLARAHHGVVQAVGARAPTAPMRLATVCRDDAAVRHVLRAEADRLNQVLARVAGRSEWSVKAYGRLTARPAGTHATATPGGPAAPGRGRDYLRRRRMARDSAEAARAALVREAAELDERLTAYADDVVRLAPHAPDAGTGDAFPISLFNAAYLVSDERVGDFRAAASAPVSDALRVEVSGPWVPYSFATPDLDEAPGPAPDDTPGDRGPGDRRETRP